MSVLLLRVEAANLLGVGDVDQLRLFLQAALRRVLAARGKFAALGQIQRVRHRAGDGFKPIAAGGVQTAGWRASGPRYRDGNTRVVEDGLPGRVSTTWPQYMTATSSAIWLMTPRSWVMNRMDGAVSLASGRSSASRSGPEWSRPAPWSARRRSAASGLQASAMAIITRWRMPPESWCGYCLATTSGFGIFTSASRSTAFARGLFLAHALVDHQRLGDLTARR